MRVSEREIPTMSYRWKVANAQQQQRKSISVAKKSERNDAMNGSMELDNFFIFSIVNRVRSSQSIVVYFRNITTNDDDDKSSPLETRIDQVHAISRRRREKWNVTRVKWVTVQFQRQETLN